MTVYGLSQLMKPLILIGGGGHCKSVLDAAESAGYNILGVLDMPEEVGKEILSTKVIGTDDDIPAYIDKAEFVITVGFIKNPTVRIKLYNRVKETGGKLATIILVCGIIGAIIGAKISVQMEVTQLRKFFGYFLALIAMHEIYVIIKGYIKRKKEA